jgi:sulfite reductase (NADPH) flavoprotein alpha-component
MLTNFWRYSHLLLAIFSSIFLLVAAITGIILSTEPVVNHVNSPSDKVAADTINLAQLVPHLRDEYIDIFSLSVDKEKAVKIDVIGFEESKDGEFYIHPSTREKVADIPPKNEVYTWVTTLHRSLFLHNTGRILMGITVFLLFLMAISGIALVIKRTNGLRHIFTKIKKQSNAQYYHTLLGRLSFIPIVIIALSGTILFLNTQFETSVNPEIEHTAVQNENINPEAFPAFQQTTLSEVIKLDFPFSEDDYYHLELHDRKLKVHQFTGEIVSKQNSTWTQNLTALSMTLHTGRGQWVWSIVLGLISINLLCFMYSGTKIAWKRLTSKTRNKVDSEVAAFIILVGSENGSTRKFANILHNAILKSGKSVFTTDLNHYQLFPKAKHLIIMTSTYGDGDAPFNARNFLSKVDEINQLNMLETHVIGFGSMMYPKFCQYAIDVYESLNTKEEFQLKVLPTLIDGRSYISFALSIEEWKKRHVIELELPSENQKRPADLSRFKVVQKQIVDDGYVLTFTLELSPPGNTNFQSGDLLAVAPPGDDLARYYSIGRTEEGNILLSIKKHTYGECSTYLFQQGVGDNFLAYIKENKTFHLPKKGDVLMIANGTGIAPFLGMTSMYSKQKKTFFLGGRNQLSFQLYHKIILQNKYTDLFNNLHFALSKEKDNNRYVQDLVLENKVDVIQLLNNRGHIMICGSIKMRDGVLASLKFILEEGGLEPLETYIEKNKILMDCY